MQKAASRVFYGWWIVLASVVVAFPSTILFNGFSGFLEPIQATFVTSTAAVSLAFVFLRAESGFGAPVAAFLVDAYGPRVITLAGGLLVGVGAVIAGSAPSLIVFYVGFVILALGSSFAGPTVATIAVAPWFDRYRGRAFALVSVGTPIWAMTIPLVVLAIDSLGWRTTMYGLGLISLGLVVPLSFVYVRGPGERGLTPDGLPPLPKTPRAAAPADSLTQMVRNPVFWSLAASYACFSFVHTGLFSQLIPILEARAGVPRSTAAAAAAAIPVVSLAGRLGLGALADFVQPRYVLALAFLMMLGGVLAILLLGGFWPILPLVLFYGVGYGGCVPIRHVLQGRIFGVKNFGRVQGVLRIIDTMVGLPAPIIAALIRDTTQSYSLALLCFAVVIAVTIPTTFSLRTHEEKKAPALSRER